MTELTDQETADPTVVDEAATATEAPTSGEASDREADSAPDADLTGEDGADDTTDTASAKEAPADLEKEGEVAADFLENLLDICDLDGDIDVDIDGDRAAVAIVDSEEGRVPRRLVGDNAKVLDALQELTRLAVQSATGHRSRLMLDVAGHRAGRRAELVEVAKVAIASVKESGEQVALDPMTAFERKVVHDEVLAAGLSSESEGVEPRRHVVVLPA
ncbi:MULTISPECIES: protein jag [unclassified Knoellia]|uniref:Jag family protein n=1 Tax=Knoellia altitudinis TaxID=3404795 RepID=UPI00361E064D